MNLQLLSKTAKQGKVPKSVFLKDTTKWREDVLKRNRFDYVLHQYGAPIGHAAGKINDVQRIANKFI